MNLYPRPSTDTYNLSPLHLSRLREWVERLHELINAKPETHPTDCVSLACDETPAGTRFVSVRARFPGGAWWTEKEQETKEKRAEILCSAAINGPSAARTERKRGGEGKERNGAYNADRASPIVFKRNLLYIFFLRSSIEVFHSGTLRV